MFVTGGRSPQTIAKRQGVMHECSCWTVVFLLLGLVLACSSERSSALPSCDGRSRLTAKQAYPIASARAKQWRQDAYLQEILITLPGHDVPIGSSEITFRFACDRRLGPLRWREGVDIVIDASQCRVIAAGKAAGKLEYTRTDIECATLDSPEALQKAEDAGGEAFRAEHPDAEVRISANCQHPDGRIYWFVGYFDRTDGHPHMLGFLIDDRSASVRQLAP